MGGFTNSCVCPFIWKHKRKESIIRKSTSGHVKDELHVNATINATDVFVIGANGEKLGILPTSQAIEKARNAGLDLVEVSPNSTPPVCKILDYGKFKYQAQKKAAEARKKQKTIDVKEVKIRPNIDTHDYEVKLRNVRRFLEHGDKVKVTVRFRGREMAHPELGAQLLGRLCGQLMEFAKIEAEPRMEGRQLTMVLIPAHYSGGKVIDLALFEAMSAPAQAPDTAEAPAQAPDTADAPAAQDAASPPPDTEAVADETDAQDGVEDTTDAKPATDSVAAATPLPSEARPLRASDNR